MIIDQVKAILGINNTGQDTKIEAFINLSISTLQAYLKNIGYDMNADDIEEKYPQALIMLTVNSYDVRKNGASDVKSMTQGQRSITYKDNSRSAFEVTSDIKAMLPKPKIKLNY